MRQVVGGRAVGAQAASASQMGRFDTETLALPENRAALADLNGQWIDRFHDLNGLMFIVLDKDSSVSPTWRSGRARLERAFRLHLLSPEHPVQPVQHAGTLRHAQGQRPQR